MKKNLVRVPLVALHALLIGLGIVWIYPFIWMIAASFKTNNEYIASGITLLPQKFQFANYKRAWETAHFSVYFWNTLIVTVSVVLIVLAVCSLTGYAIGRYRFRGRLLFVTAVTATMFMPKGYTIIPVYSLVNALGLNNSLWGVIVAEAGSGHILFILLFVAYFRGLPKEMEESAEIDGSGFFRTFASIMLPMAKPIIATTAIMQFMWTWNAFLLPLIFTLSKPNLRTLGVGMFQFVGENTMDWTGMAAAASISLLPILTVFILLQRYFIEGVSGAIKG
ncbi:carbohydrate ABC transporter permease [Paenibacillus sp. GCM10023248]|uniref:carbohydrate ABC transporter permease n=1 Tax=Bacillales TaxID=1385 RepID=UPI002379673B|nr:MULTISPECIES: carbohydrate ABC transporter permease [Bacillales]MDD9268609.1 carbohydrate ABC transporter permease [Paenibacillus sp. MAHUQ-63]MDR6879510.1 raffinose/stachyose/melibiose transport system permease protein [Bacillus sp. 3255]